MSDEHRPPPKPIELEAIVDIEGLRGVMLSYYSLFGVPVRLFSASGALLVEEGEQAALCRLINAGPAGRRACSKLVNQVKRTASSAAQACSEECFSSAQYDVVPIERGGERVGRFVLGPYRCQSDAEQTGQTSPTGQAEALPASLLEVDPKLDRAKATEALAAMVALTSQRAALLKEHLAALVELVMASGYEALVTSKMHVASMAESYRQLEDKNAELLDANARFRELDSLKTSFLSTMSHELRTPLTSIIGYGDMLVDGLAGELNTEQREFLQIILRQSDQLLELIRSLLDVSKLEQGTLTVDKVSVSLSEVLKEVVTSLTPRAVDLGVFIDLKSLEEGLAVCGDRARLRQVFLNVVENSLKFSTAGGCVTIHASRHEESEQAEVGYILFAPLRQLAEIRIVDLGPGVPHRDKTRVFDAFYQVDQTSSREHSGTGLGLSIVKRLVDAHGGSVHVQDNEPNGSVFVVRLPIWRPPS